MRIATSRYHAKNLIDASGLVPLGHTVGAARWLAYELAGNVGPLAPHGMFGKDVPEEEFIQSYRDRLERFGVERIRAILEAFADAYDADGVVLLCFEDVHKGEFCHRRVFAQWWEEKTGEPVLELDPAQLTIG